MNRNSETQAEPVNIASQIRMAWQHRNWIMGGTALFTLIGLVYAFTAPSVFQSSATISLKETQGGGTASSVLSQLGGFGGMVAAQLGKANTNLDKLEVILTGEELALNVIESNNLLPVLFPKAWDSAKSAWKGKPPRLRDAADVLMHEVLSVSVERIKHMMVIRTTSHDPELSKKLVEYYLAALNRKLQEDARLESSTNRAFLESQLNNTSDPIIREKILTLIAMEIEKEMLVGSQAIEILRKPAVPMYRESPKRKKILVMAFMVGLCISITIVYSLPVLRRLSGGQQ